MASVSKIAVVNEGPPSSLEHASMKAQVTLVAIAVVGLAALLAVSEASLTSEVKRCSDEWTRCVDAEELAQIPESERRYVPGIPSDKCSMRY